MCYDALCKTSFYNVVVDVQISLNVDNDEYDNNDNNKVYR